MTARHPVSQRNIETTPGADRTRATRRSEWSSRTAKAVFFAFVVALGTANSPTDVFAQPPTAVAAATAPALEVTRDMQTDLAVLAEQVGASLDERVKAQTDAILQQVVDQEIAALLEQRQQKLARRTQAPNSVHPQMETIHVRADRKPAVEKAENRSIELARRSLEIGQ